MKVDPDELAFVALEMDAARLAIANDFGRAFARHDTRAAGEAFVTLARREQKLGGHAGPPDSRRAASSALRALLGRGSVRAARHSASHRLLNGA